MIKCTYLRGYDPPESVLIRDLSYDPSDDILVLVLSDYTTLHASYLERKEGGWVAGIPDNY